LVISCIVCVQESSATKRIFLVLLLFTICWMPLQTMNCLSLFTGWFSQPGIIVAVFLSHANSAFNPILYALTNPKIMAAIKATVGLKPGNKVEYEVSVSKTNGPDTGR